LPKTLLDTGPRTLRVEIAQPEWLKPSNAPANALQSANVIEHSAVQPDSDPLQ
jgi:hypothetical protein